MVKPFGLESAVSSKNKEQKRQQARFRSSNTTMNKMTNKRSKIVKVYSDQLDYINWK